MMKLVVLTLVSTESGSFFFFLMAQQCVNLRSLENFKTKTNQANGFKNPNGKISED